VLRVAEETLEKGGVSISLRRMLPQYWDRWCVHLYSTSDSQSYIGALDVCTDACSILGKD